MFLRLTRVEDCRLSGYSSSYLYTCLFSTLNLAALKCLSETHLNIECCGELDPHT